MEEMGTMASHISSLLEINHNINKKSKEYSLYFFLFIEFISEYCIDFSDFLR